MTPEQTKQFNDMMRKVNELYLWMEARKKQQLTSPLDSVSQNVIKEITNFITFVRPAASTITENSRINVRSGGFEYQINCRKVN